MNKRNYHRELTELMAANDREGIRPSLLLHVCCAVCASSVLERLYGHFKITILYYNPNITEEREYLYRLSELRRYVAERDMNEIQFLEADYEPDSFFELVKGRENDPEGGGRCGLCFYQRLSYTAEKAAEGGYDLFATTLTVSPLKNAEAVNAAGERAARDFGAAYLPTDFKKGEGYKRSIELSREYGLYRQNYCGCVFSKKNRMNTENVER